MKRYRDLRLDSERTIVAEAILEEQIYGIEEEFEEYEDYEDEVPVTEE